MSFRIIFGGFFFSGYNKGVMFMKRQCGQTMVEFALIAPMIFLMIFGMMWGGFMFMEYLRFSNDLRAAARDIAITSVDKRLALEAQYKTELENTYNEHLPKLYKPDIIVTHDDDDAIIKVTFVRRNDLPSVLMWANFPPDKIPALEYRMKLENSNRTTSQNDTSSENSSATGQSLTDSVGNATGTSSNSGGGN